MINASPETKDEVRKWLNRFFKDGDQQGEFWRRVEQFIRRNGRPPLTNDVIWGMLNERRDQHFKNGNLGFYRNETLSMYTLLDLEGRTGEQLKYAAHITAMDGCGVANLGWDRGPIDQECAFIAPICPGLIAESGLLAGLSFEETKTEFLRHAQDLLNLLNVKRDQVDADAIWSQVAPKVEEIFAQGMPKRRKRKSAPSLQNVST